VRAAKQPKHDCGNKRLTRALYNQLDGVNIMRNDDQLGLLVLNQVGDVVDSVLDEFGFLTLLNGLSLLATSACSKLIK
jgi:hypothetical protein